FDGILREPEYSADHEVRRVRHSGEIKWQGGTIYIYTALAGEPISLIETDGGGWSLTGRSISASLPMGVTACGGPNPPPVDMWTTLRVDHMPTGAKTAPTRLSKMRNVLPMYRSEVLPLFPVAQG